ncbi:MAG: hypothetical protein WBD27_15050 [Pyrinomonadaceae bacterium]
MPSWNELLAEFQAAVATGAGSGWIGAQIHASLRDISALREDRNVIFYSSAFLQKPNIDPSLLQITHEEINGFMSVMYGMDWTKGLTLLLHTPGGVTNAAETVVAYLRSKFDFIETIVPAFAMSAGTMISLATDRIIMGRQSQLGPIDPQMPVMGRYVSARAVVDQFERAKGEILGNLNAAHVWAPILQSLGPALLNEAENALSYGESMVSKWLSERMFRTALDPTGLAAATAFHFNDASTHKSHGRRIDRDEARAKNVVVVDLEEDQALQEAVLTAYHLMTILFEQGPAAKIIASNRDRLWAKNVASPTN